MLGCDILQSAKIAQADRRVLAQHEQQCHCARDATCVSVLIPEFPWNIIRLVNFLDHENSDDPVDEMSLFYVAQTRVKDQQILGVQRLYLPSAATLIPIGQSSEIGIEMHPLFLKMNGKQLPPCCKRGLELLIKPLKPSTQWFRFQDWRIDEPARLCVSWRIPPTIIRRVNSDTYK